MASDRQTNSARLEQAEAAGVPRSLLDDPRYVRAGGFLDQMEWFDAGFFVSSSSD